jgi:hypothetical protein
MRHHFFWDLLFEAPPFFAFFEVFLFFELAFLAEAGLAGEAWAAAPESAAASWWWWWWACPLPDFLATLFLMVFVFLDADLFAPDFLVGAFLAIGKG